MQESRVTEERKFAILFAATILAARKLIDLDRTNRIWGRDFSWIALSRMLLSFSNGSMRDGLRL
jgi:hypothetical protein